ncbi:MAG: hypothetical protein JNK81_16495 [Anaerolineales bacterium]|nr:hypothetical protein [Anaerolineales bacterium]
MVNGWWLAVEVLAINCQLPTDLFLKYSTEYFGMKKFLCFDYDLKTLATNASTGSAQVSLIHTGFLIRFVKIGVIRG